MNYKNNNAWISKIFALTIDIFNHLSMNFLKQPGTHAFNSSSTHTPIVWVPCSLGLRKNEQSQEMPWDPHVPMRPRSVPPTFDWADDSFRLQRCSTWPGEDPFDCTYSPRSIFGSPVVSGEGPSVPAFPLDQPSLLSLAGPFLLSWAWDTRINLHISFCAFWLTAPKHKNLDLSIFVFKDHTQVFIYRLSGILKWEHHI